MKQLIEQPVRKIFNALGYGIQSQKRRRTTLESVIEHVLGTGFRPRTVIDVGVASGTFELYKFPGAKYLLIDPLKEFENTFKNISKRYNGEYVIAAASDTKGTISLNVHADLSGSSFFKEMDGGDMDGVPRTVSTVTIDDVCDERGLRGPFVIKIDAQGAELKILDGAKKTLEETELIILEISLFQGYKNIPQFYDVVHYMKQHGFVVYDFYDGHNRPVDGALAQIDTVFVKENGRFRKSHAYHKSVM
jgi:FkbM family methyltransferase